MFTFIYQIFLQSLKIRKGKCRSRERGCKLQFLSLCISAHNKLSLAQKDIPKNALILLLIGSSSPWYELGYLRGGGGGNVIPPPFQNSFILISKHAKLDQSRFFNLLKLYTLPGSALKVWVVGGMWLVLKVNLVIAFG